MASTTHSYVTLCALLLLALVLLLLMLVSLL